MTVLDAPLGITKFAGEYSSSLEDSGAYRIQDEEVRIDRTKYDSMKKSDRREFDLIRAKIVETYLQNRDKLDVGTFASKMSKIKLRSKKSEYFLTEERIIHIIRNLKEGLRQNYSHAIGKNPKDFDGGDRERAYGILERKVEAARENPAEDRKILSYENLKREFNPEFAEKKKGFFGRLRKVLDYKIW